MVPLKLIEPPDCKVEFDVKTVFPSIIKSLLDVIELPIFVCDEGFIIKDPPEAVISELILISAPVIFIDFVSIVAVVLTLRVAFKTKFKFDPLIPPGYSRLS